MNYDKKTQKKKLLVNYVYWQNVGHAIEALRYTLGYHKANPDWEISLILNEHTTFELANLCPWIKNIYTVDLPDDDTEITIRLYNHIPQEWDYVVSNHRSETEEWCPGSFFEYYQQVKGYFKIKHTSGYCGDSSIPYSPNQRLDLSLPKSHIDWAEKHQIDSKIKIAFLFAGHKERKFFPSMRSWEHIIDSLYERYGKDLSVYYVGILEKGSHRTKTSVSRNELEDLLRKYPESVNCFDVGLLNQLAMVKNCDLFISPHSGFSFAALAVGTPWLTISGGRWAEYFYNGVPFYSVLPNRKKYQVYEDKDFDKTTIEEGEERILSMSYERILEDLPEILKGADILINKRATYEECLQNHFQKLEMYYDDPYKIWSFDNLHTKYIAYP